MMRSRFALCAALLCWTMVSGCTLWIGLPTATTSTDAGDALSADDDAAAAPNDEVPDAGAGRDGGARVQDAGGLDGGLDSGVIDSGTPDGGGVPADGPTVTDAAAGGEDAGIVVKPEDDDAGHFDAGIVDGGGADAHDLDAGPGEGSTTDGGGDGPRWVMSVNAGTALRDGEQIRLPNFVLGGSVSTRTLRIENRSASLGVPVNVRIEARSASFRDAGFALHPPADAVVPPLGVIDVMVSFATDQFVAHGATLVVALDGEEYRFALDVTVEKPFALLGGAGGRRILTDYADTWIDVDDGLDEALNDAMARRHYAIHGVGFGGGRFFAVGTAHVDAQPRARMLSTVDGVHWVECISRHTDDLPAYEPYLHNASAGCTLPDDIEPLVDITYGNGVYLAVSSHQTLRSDDGLHFEKINDEIFMPSANGGPTPAATRIDFGGGAFLVSGSRDTTVSADGVVWTHAVQHDHLIRGVAYFAPRWMLVGDTLARTTSEDDGVTWSAPLTEVQMYDGKFFSVTASDQGFVALSELWTWNLTDVDQFTRHYTQGRPQGVCQKQGSNTYFYVDGYYNYARSTYQQDYYLVEDALGPANGTIPWRTVESLNDIADVPVCGALYAPPPSP